MYICKVSYSLRCSSIAWLMKSRKMGLYLYKMTSKLPSSTWTNRLPINFSAVSAKLLCHFHIWIWLLFLAIAEGLLSKRPNFEYSIGMSRYKKQNTQSKSHGSIQLILLATCSINGRTWCASRTFFGTLK